MKALIIDDEIDICYLLSNILKTKNLQTSYVNSLAEARIAIQAEVPAIIFIDNHLPDGRGIGLIPDIKQSCPGTKVVMITAHDNTEDRNKAIEKGVDSFISKPFSSDTITRTIDQLLSKV